MKNLFYIFFLLFILKLSAQEIKLEKNIVFYGNSPTFSFAKKSMGNQFYVYKLNTKEELFSILVDNNNTESKVDDSKKIVFTQQNITIQSKNFREQKWDFLINLLIEEKVIDLKGEINLDNLKRFKAKYDEKDVNKTMR